MATQRRHPPGPPSSTKTPDASVPARRLLPARAQRARRVERGEQPLHAGSWAVPRLVRAGLWLSVAVLLVPLGEVLTPVRLPMSAYLGLLVTAALMGIGLVLVRALRARQERFIWTCLGAALLSWALGTVVYLEAAGSPLLDGISVTLWWAFYPLAYLALAGIVRVDLRRFPAGIVIDGLAAGFAVAALVTAYALPSLLARAESIVGLAGTFTFPVFDALLLGTGVGLFILAPHPVRPARILLVTALVAYAGAGVLWTVQETGGGYVPGGPVDLLYMVTITLTAWAAWRRPVRAATTPTVGEQALLVPVAATLLALGVLVGDHFRPTSPPAVTLAAVAVLLSGIRAATTIRSLRLLAQARHEASTDDLTGLANRRAILAQLRDQKAGSGDPKALILVDLDRFKEVNDSLGHDAGDLLLAEVGRRLTATLPFADILARLGGDEFAALLDGATVEQAGSAARRVRDALSAPIDLDGVVVHVDASVGVAACPEHSSAPADMMRLADIAMYRAKRTLAGVAAYDPALDHVDHEGLDRVHELRAALDANELRLYYQPRLDLRSGQVRWVEALLRWQHPRLGMLGPMEFLPVAEHTGLMRSVTSFVVTEALAQVAAWRAAGLDLGVSINISGSDLADADLPDEIVAQAARHQVPADRVQVEVTELTLVADRTHGAQLLERLRAAGMGVAVDDFGTGYSSLTYLCDLPVDDLKLDRSFAAGLPGSERALSVVRSTVALAHELGMRLVAEGVERRDALIAVTGLGCDEAQGFYIARPMAAEHLEQWLARHEGRPSGVGANRAVNR